jgi:hypothetical protein
MRTNLLVLFFFNTWCLFLLAKIPFTTRDIFNNTIQKLGHVISSDYGHLNVPLMTCLVPKNDKKFTTNKTLGVRHHQKTKRAFCTCGKYNDHYSEGVSKHMLLTILLYTYCCYFHTVKNSKLSFVYAR